MKLCSNPTRVTHLDSHKNPSYDIFADIVSALFIGSAILQVYIYFSYDFLFCIIVKNIQNSRIYFLFLSCSISSLVA